MFQLALAPGRPGAKLRRIITLTELRAHPELSGLPLLKRGNRLSVMPVSPAHWDFILGLE